MDSISSNQISISSDFGGFHMSRSISCKCRGASILSSRIMPENPDIPINSLNLYVVAFQYAFAHRLQYRFVIAFVSSNEQKMAENCVSSGRRKVRGIWDVGAHMPGIWKGLSKIYIYIFIINA